MDTKFVTLSCPKCGSSEQTLDQELRFGIEYKCKHCGSTSVLIINNRLYMPMPGEKVCLACGRVADRDARFCQCGQPLVRRCINPDCLREFPVDHLVCDYCGWKQEILPNSEEGNWLEFQHAMRDFFDPQPSIHKHAYDDIMAFLGKCYAKEEVDKAIRELDAHKIDSVPFLINSISPGMDTDSIEFLLTALREKGVDASDKARQSLTQMLERSFDKETIDTVIFSLQELGVDAVKMLRKIITDYPSDTRVMNAIRILETHGESAYADIEEVALNSAISVHRKEAFNLMVNWILKSGEGSRYREKFVVTSAKYLNRSEDEMSSSLMNAGAALPEFLVEVMDAFDSYKVRKKCWDMLVSIGKPCLKTIQQLKDSNRISNPTREWLSTAINKIEGKYPHS